MENQEPTNDLDKHLIKSMSIKVVERLEIQCPCEYWNENPNLRLPLLTNF